MSKQVTNGRFTELGYCVGKQFLPALFYGDVSGLTDNECAELDVFDAVDIVDARTKFSAPGIVGHWTVRDESTLDGEYLAVCDITRTVNDCVEVNYVMVSK